MKNIRTISILTAFTIFFICSINIYARIRFSDTNYRYFDAIEGYYENKISQYSMFIPPAKLHAIFYKNTYYLRSIGSIPLPDMPIDTSYYISRSKLETNDNIVNHWIYYHQNISEYAWSTKYKFSEVHNWGYINGGNTVHPNDDGIGDYLPEYFYSYISLNNPLNPDSIANLRLLDDRILDSDVFIRALRNNSTYYEKLIIDADPDPMDTTSKDFFIVLFTPNQPLYGMEEGKLYWSFFYNTGDSLFVCYMDALDSNDNTVICNNYSDILEHSSIENIQISPNPTSNYLDVILSNVCEKIIAEVVDLEGKSLFTIKFENKKDFRINFPINLPNGIYSLLLNVNNKRSTTNFIIAK